MSRSKGLLQVHFLLLLPYLLPMPMGGEGTPIDMHEWERDRALREANRSAGELSESWDPSSASVAVQLVHNIIPHSSPLTGLQSLLQAVPDLWPWQEVFDQGGPDLSREFSEAEASVVSARVSHHDGLLRWEADPDTYLTDCFEKAVVACQDLQRAVSVVSGGHSAPLITAPDLTPMVPYSILQQDLHGKAPRNVVTGVFPNHKSLQVRRLDRAQHLPLDRLQAALNSVEQDSPFLPTLNLDREAAWSRAAGDYWTAVIRSAASTEMLVHALARFMMWEEGMAPEEASAVLRDSSTGVVAFANTHLSGRLKGRWSKDSKGPVKKWHEDLIATRNAAIHAGRGVSETDADRAVRAGVGMLNFVKEQLLIDRVLPHYPLTAVNFWGEPGLARRKALTRRVKTALREAPSGYTHRFRLWKESVEASPITKKPTPEDCLLIGVIEAETEQVQWVVRVLDSPWAAQARITEAVPQNLANQIPGLRDSAKQDGHERIEISLPAFRGWEKLSDWVLSYRLLPSHACMLR